MTEEGTRGVKLDSYFRELKQWKDEFALLREIALECGLTEDFKWMHPCYTYEGKNIVLIHGFKHYCALLFHKGALLTDPQGILVRQTPNVQLARQVRFTSINEIREVRPLLQEYIKEAIELERAGSPVRNLEKPAMSVPDELRRKFEEVDGLKAAFEALTPGRQRAYLLYFSGAKQAKTREARIDKCIPRILSGKGLND